MVQSRVGILWPNYIQPQPGKPFQVPNKWHILKDFIVPFRLRCFCFLMKWSDFGTTQNYSRIPTFNSLKHWYRNHYFLRVLKTKWRNLSCLDLGTAAFKAIHPREAEQFCKEARLQKFWLQSKSLSRAAARARNFRSSSSSNSKLPLREKDIYERYGNTWQNVIFIIIFSRKQLLSFL